MLCGVSCVMFAFVVQTLCLVSEIVNKDLSTKCKK